MGQNVTRLFAEARADVFCEDGDSDRLGILLYRHGEALCLDHIVDLNKKVKEAKL